MWEHGQPRSELLAVCVPLHASELPLILVPLQKFPCCHVAKPDPLKNDEQLFPFQRKEKLCHILKCHIPIWFFSTRKHYCSSNYYLHFVELSLTLYPLNHHTCSSVCVSGHFSSCVTLLCVCLPPRVESEFESISASVHGRISINSSWSVLWQYSHCWPSLSATTYSVTSPMNGGLV